eukprot:30910-Pelagococcus_subviridis.AAC.7
MEAFADVSWQTAFTTPTGSYGDQCIERGVRGGGRRRAADDGRLVFRSRRKINEEVVRRGGARRRRARGAARRGVRGIEEDQGDESVAARATGVENG